MSQNGVEDAMQKGLAFLASSQLADGSFESFSSPQKKAFKPTRTYQTIFTPALILGALNLLSDPLAITIRERLTAWLLTQKSPAWSFNYWAHSAPERQSLPYPDDLDDTFCALIALQEHDATLIDQACLAHVVKLLIATESAVGGPYRTWLADKDAPAAWQDIDLAVNANIAAFLRLVAEPLPNITKLLETAIAAQAFRSPYYPSAYPIVYYIARAYDGPEQLTLANFIFGQQRHGYWQSPLQTALALASLARLGQLGDRQKALGYLLQRQLPDGSWPAEAFCIDPAIQGKTHYSGAPALTTAFVLEALAYATTRPTVTPRQIATKNTNTIYRAAWARLQKELSLLSPALRLQSQAILDRTIKNDADHEILLLPYYFNASLTKPVMDQRLLQHLSLANAYGWMAYTVYDDFLDDEGQPRQLSAAHVALRRSLQHFKEALPRDDTFHTFVGHTFDTIDNANTWETMRCRFIVAQDTIQITQPPRYPNSLMLADRSMGHTLTPLGVLAAQNIPATDRRTAALRLAFRHYLAARQLNDDLHDWEQDTRTGLATYVVTAILQGLGTRTGKHDFESLLPKMQQHFWHHTLPAICRVIRTHTQRARRAAASSHLLTDSNIITQLTAKIDQSVQLTLTEQGKAEAFLAAYRKSDE